MLLMLHNWPKLICCCTDSLSPSLAGRSPHSYYLIVANTSAGLPERSLYVPSLLLLTLERFLSMACSVTMQQGGGQVI